MSDHVKEDIAGPTLRECIEVARKAGYVVLRPKFAAPYLKKYGFQARTIVDVGVCTGTRPLYQAFPERKFVLVEPLPGSEELTRKRFPKLNMDFFACGAGAASGESEFMVNTEFSWFSGFLPRLGNASSTQSLKVKIERLDSILSNPKYERPFGIKIDVEGFELEVLEGLGALASDVEFFIVESALKRAFERKNRFSDLVVKMKELGFELADILNIVRHQPSAQDFLFLQKDDMRFSP